MLPAIAAHFIAALLAAAAAAQGRVSQLQAQPTSRPAELLRVVRGVVVEEGRRAQDVAHVRMVIQNPVYRSWAAWGVGTRVVARLDEIDREGRNFPVQRYAMRLDELTGERIGVTHFRIMPGGTAGEQRQQAHPAQIERAAILLARQSSRMLYWRRYEARVALELATSQPTEDRRSRRSRRQAQAPASASPTDALPAEFDCAIIETVHLAVPDEAANDDPALARPGDELVVIRSYHHVDAPGWEVMLETYRATLGEDGIATDLDLASRWRIEWILRPQEADPTPQQLDKGLPPDR